jgi:hypothetical protein
MNSREKRYHLMQRAFKNGFLMDKELLDRLPDECFEIVLAYAKRNNKRIVTLNDLFNVIMPKLDKYYSEMNKNERKI